MTPFFNPVHIGQVTCVAGRKAYIMCFILGGESWAAKEHYKWPTLYYNNVK